LQLVEPLPDEALRRLRLGGHDPRKIYAAYKAAVDHQGSPTVILAATIKGYGLGEGGEGRNITHQQKKLNEEELREFRSRFGIPLSDEQVTEASFYRPAGDSREMQYLLERRKDLGGFLPARISPSPLAGTSSPSPLAGGGRGGGGPPASTSPPALALPRKGGGNEEVPRKGGGSAPTLKAPPREAFGRFLKGSGKSAVSTTGGFVEVLKFLLQDKALGKW